MSKLHISASPTLKGKVYVPPSKSHSMRAILLASLAEGTSVLQGVLQSPDTDAMLAACKQLGASWDWRGETLYITGVAGEPCMPSQIIDAGNSGQVARFITGIAGLISGCTTLTGDESIQTRRPLQPLLDGLQQLGASAVSTHDNGLAPVVIKGPINAGRARIDGFLSQPVSGLLMACSFLEGETILTVDNPNEFTWIELTLCWLRRLGVDITHNNYMQYCIRGRRNYPAFEATISGDFSSAAFPIAAALITRGRVTLHNLDPQDVQGDKAIIEVLQSMGANIQWDPLTHALHVDGSRSELCGQAIEANLFIDAVPILAVIGCYATGTTVLHNIASARLKESDRLAAMTRELQAMGSHIEMSADKLTIHGSSLHGAVLSSHHDHRIAMALAVAALGAEGKTSIQNIDCIAKSYSSFVRDFQRLGAHFSLHS